MNAWPWARLTSTSSSTFPKLFSEGPDSPYANVVVARSEDAENPAILALVDALTSEETREFIREKYGDAVIPVE